MPTQACRIRSFAPSPPLPRKSPSTNPLVFQPSTSGPVMVNRRRLNPALVIKDVSCLELSEMMLCMSSGRLSEKPVIKRAKPLNSTLSAILVTNSPAWATGQHRAKPITKNIPATKEIRNDFKHIYFASSFGMFCTLDMFVLFVLK